MAASSATNPACCVTPSPSRPTHTVRQVVQLSDQWAYPVSGVRRRKVVGLVTGRDLRFETRLDLPVSQIMTPKAKLVTVPERHHHRPGQGTAEPTQDRTPAGGQ